MDAVKVSEIRRFLLKFAQREGIKLHEHFSDGHYFCHLDQTERTSTACSQESADNALAMAFLSLENRKYNFLD